MFVSNRGVGLCCNADVKYDMDPWQFWHSEQRQIVLQKQKENKKISDCAVCYKSEQQNLLSYRQRYNQKAYLDDSVKELPIMLDLDFSNFCNLKCVMCNPGRSSQWAKELGIHEDTNGVQTISDQTLYSTCRLSHALQKLVIQGGEPSIMPEFQKYFEYLIQHNLAKNIDLEVITNLTNVNNKFFDSLKNFKSVTLGVSIDAFGTANDYIRFPSNFDQITKNLKIVSEMSGNISVEIFNAVQILSMLNYGQFLEWCHEVEKIFDAKNKKLKLVPLLVTSPKIYSILNAPLELREKFTKDIKQFKSENKDALTGNSRMHTELSIFLKKLSASTPDLRCLRELEQQISTLDTTRNIDINDYITNFSEVIRI